MADHIWAPWRLPYIESAKDSSDGCIFVELPAQTKDRENLILFRGERAFVMLNAFPYTSGHLMVAPYRHTASMADLDDEELLEIQKLVVAAIAWLSEAYRPEGFNVGANLGKSAGAGIPTHIHWHIVPRWSGDTNFITTIGEARVLPQSLLDSYDRLHAIANRTS